MKNLSLLLFLAAFLVSCGSKKITEQQKSFTDKTWQPGQNLTYEFTIIDTAASYDISAVVKHFNNFPLDRVSLSFTLEDPAGEKRISEHDLVIRNKKGQFLGKKFGDTITMDFAIRNRYKFRAPGKAKVTLVSRISSTATFGIGGISIVVRKRN